MSNVVDGMKYKRRTRRRRPLQSPSRSLLSICFLYWLSCLTRGHEGGLSSLESARGLFPHAFAQASAVEDEKDENREGRPVQTIRGRTTSRKVLAVDLSESKPTLNQILIRAGKRGLGGGFPGAMAGVVQVITLMWLRTIMSYQCRYGTTFSQALVTLLREGGIARLYRGLTFAVIQAPLARFVSTAANDGVESLLASFSWTKSWGPGRTTVVASIFVGFFRILLMPIDTMKTVLQVDSVEGFRNLMRRVKAGRIGALYQGAIATAISAVLGHYPWFYTYNLLSASELMKRILPSSLLRNAGVGMIASIVSDTVVNAMRVIKTTKQSLATKHSMTYSETIQIVLAADGWSGLFGRGLKTRIFCNALQSIVFTIIWRGLADYMKRRSAEGEEEA